MSGRMLAIGIARKRDCCESKPLIRHSGPSVENNG
jgi:hypothetical protein